MADPKQSKAHLWVNSIIAALALGVAGISAYTSWQANSLNHEESSLLRREDISASAAPAEVGCKFGIAEDTYDGKRHNDLLMCWHVVIANKSELRIAFVDDVAGVPPGYSFPGLNALEDSNGSILSYPIVLDGGQALSFVVRWPIEIPDRIASLAADLQYKIGTVAPFSLDALVNKAHSVGFDLLGNEMRKDKTGYRYIQPLEKMSFASENFSLCTGRRTCFDISLGYPWGVSAVRRYVLRR